MRIARSRFAAPIAALLLAACAPAAPQKTPGSSAMALPPAYAACRTEALGLEQEARSSGSAADYRAAAARLDDCDVMADSAVTGDDRIRLLALAVVSHLKGGDPAAARISFDRLRTHAPDRDLDLGGGSFVATAALLLEGVLLSPQTDLALPEIPELLRAELRRARYWTRN